MIKFYLYIFILKWCLEALAERSLCCNTDAKAQSKTNCLIKSLLLKLLGKKKRPSLWKQGIGRLNDLLQVIPE